jgi:choline kinase
LKAIILAAGQGKRLRPLTEKKPKCLLEIDSTTIIGRQLNILKSFGISEFVVVVGYGNSWNDESRNRIINMPYNIRMVINKESLNVESAHSLLLALEYVEPPILVIDGDVVFARGLIENLLRSTHRSAIVSRPAKDIHEEGGKVLLENDRVIAIGRNITQGTHGKNPWYIYSGIMKVESDLFTPLKKELVTNIDIYRKAAHVDVINKLCRSIYIHNVTDDRWVNVNTIELYSLAKRMVKIWQE